MQPTLICTHPWKGRSRWAGRRPVKPSNSKKPCAVSDSRGEELGEAVDLAGAEGDIDEREALEDLLLDRLRPAPPHADDPLGPFVLQPLGLAEVGDEAGVGGLADRAGVEEDQVGLGTRGGLAVAERLEHPLHPLGVVLVHLAAERGYVVERHRDRVPAGRP